MATIFKPFPVVNLMGGWRPDIPTELLKPGQFAAASGVRFYNGRVEKLRGWKTIPNSMVSGVPGLICRARFQDGTDVPVIATDINVYQLNADFSLTQLNLAPYTAPAPPFATNIRWETASFPSSFFLNRRDGALKIQKWNGTTFGDIDNPAFGTIVGTPPRGQSIDTYKNHLAIGAITDDGNGNIGLQSVGLSDLAANSARGENNWDYGNPASEAVIEGFFQGNDNVRLVKRMGDYFIVYKEETIDTLVYTSGTFIYLNQEPITYTGTPSPSSIIGARGIHYGLFNDNFYKCNGADIEPIGNGIYQTFLATLMPANPEDLWGFNDVIRNEIVWVGESLSTPFNAVAYNYDNGAWSLRQFPFTAAQYVNLTQTSPDWNSRSEEWSAYLEDWFNVATLNNLSILGADTFGNLYTLYGPGVYDNTTIAQLATGLFDFGEPGRIKMVNEIRIDGNSVNDGNMKVFVFAGDNAGNMNLNGPYTVQNNRVTCTVSGRYIQVLFVKTGGYFDLNRFTVFWRLRGRF